MLFKMALSLVDLTDYEQKAIGKSIVGLEKPDLSMFPIGARDNILRHSVEFLAGKLNTPAGEDAGQKIPRLLSLITQSHIKESVVWDLRDAHISNDTIKDELYSALGLKQELLEKAEDQLSSSDKDYNHSLDDILRLYELGGKKLDNAGIGAVALRYLVENINPGRLVQSVNKLKELGISPKIPKRNLVSVIRACEAQYGISNQTSRDTDQAEAFAAIISILTQYRGTAAKDVKLAVNSAEANCFRVAYLFSSIALNRKTSEEASIDKQAISNIADLLVENGFFYFARYLFEGMGQSFDNKKAFDVFFDGMRNKSPRFNRLTEMGHYLLHEATEHELREFSEKVYGAIKNSHSFRGNSRLPGLFVLNAYKKLNERPEVVSELTNRLKHSGDNRKNPATPERIQITQINLGPALAGIKGFDDAVVAAYDANGFLGVQKVIQQYGSLLGEKDFTHPYGGSAVEVVESAFAKKGRKITSEKDRFRPEDDYAVAATRFSLAHGSMGTGYGSLFEVRRRPDLIGKIDSAIWALGMADFLLKDDPEFDHAVKVAEIAAKQAGVPVPPILYRFAAAEYLGYVTDLRPSADGKVSLTADIGGAYSAWEFYKKAGDKGFVSFVENNFLKGKDLR